MYKSLILVAVLSTALSGCLVDNNGKRAIVGGAIGAVGADALGYDPVTGAAIGVGIGALCSDAGIGVCNN